MGIERVVPNSDLNGYTWLCLTVLLSMVSPLLISFSLDSFGWDSVANDRDMMWNYILLGLNAVSELTMLIGYNLLYKTLGANDGQWMTTYLASVLPYVGLSTTAFQVIQFITDFV